MLIIVLPLPVSSTPAAKRLKRPEIGIVRVPCCAGLSLAKPDVQIFCCIGNPSRPSIYQTLQSLLCAGVACKSGQLWSKHKYVSDKTCFSTLHGRKTSAKQAREVPADTCQPAQTPKSGSIGSDSIHCPHPQTCPDVGPM